MNHNLPNAILLFCNNLIHRHSKIWRITLLAITILGFAATAYLIVTTPKLPNRGCDFFHRHNEIQSILAHKNPYDTWKNFTSVSQMVQLPNAPWAYSLALPICWLPRPQALFVFSILELLCIGALLFWTYQTLIKEMLDARYAILFTSLSLFGALRKDLSVGNYVIFCALGVSLMIYFLNHDHQFLAGLSWTLVMIKPQLGVLLFIPLFLNKRYVCIATAIITCCLLSLIPSILLSENPIKLLLQTTELGAQMAADSSRGGLFLLCYRIRQLPIEVVYKFAFWFGVALVCLLSWFVRKSNNWLLKLAPAAVYGSFWVYANLCNLNMALFAIVLLSVFIVKSSNPIVVVVSLLLWGISILPIPHNLPGIALFIKYFIELVTIIFIIYATKKDQTLEKQFYDCKGKED